MQVGECRALHSEEVADAGFGRGEARCHLVFDEIVRQMVAEPADISGVDQLVQASRSCCVIR